MRFGVGLSYRLGYEQGKGMTLTCGAGVAAKGGKGSGPLRAGFGAAQTGPGQYQPKGARPAGRNRPGWTREMGKLGSASGPKREGQRAKEKRNDHLG
jgi:hypothetical protein